MTAYYNEIDPFAAAWLRELIKEGLIAPGEVDERSIEDVIPSELMGYDQCHFFAGIGVWSYALRQAGWPDERPVWSGSCPCQPFSAAGKGEGTSDERHLWPAFFWLIRQCRPVVCFGEQVEAAMRHDWLDHVALDLEGEGYSVGAVSSPACGYGAPHHRQRLYWVAVNEIHGWRQVNENNRRSRKGNFDARCKQRIRSNSPARRMGDSGKSGHEGATTEQNNNSGCEQMQTGRTGPTNGFWYDAEWIYCRDEKWRPTECKFIALPNGVASNMVPMCGRSSQKDGIEETEEINASEYQTRSSEVLRIMQKADESEKIQWDIGVNEHVPKKKILRSGVYGEGAGDGNLFEFEPQQGQGSQDCKTEMRTMREDEKNSRSSHRWKSEEQRQREFEIFVRLVPSSYSLAQLHGDSSTAEALRPLLKAYGKNRFMQHTPDTFQEIWRSVSKEDQDRLRVAFNSGRFVKSIEHPLANNQEARVMRLRGYGNAIVAPQAEAFIRAFMEIADDPD